MLETNNEPIEVQQTKKKKEGFFKRNKNKISKIGSILINIACVLGISASVIAHVIIPPLMIATVPSLLTLFFTIILEAAPEKLEDAKKLLLAKMNSSNDQTAIEQVYNDVTSNYQQLSNRSNTNVNMNLPTPAEDEQLTQRLPARLVYNTKTKILEYELQEH